jgi:hypothetical protein
VAAIERTAAGETLVGIRARLVPDGRMGARRGARPGREDTAMRRFAVLALAAGLSLGLVAGAVAATPAAVPARDGWVTTGIGVAKATS